MSNKTEKIQIWVSPEQKNQLRRLAELEQKSMSEYLIDAALSSASFSTNCDSDFAKIEAKIENITADVTYIKKFQYVVTRLALYIVNEYVKDPKKTMEYFREILSDADEKFAEKGD